MIGESRRDRLRRILKKLLSDRREVAVPVAVPVLPTVPGQEVAQLPVWSSSDKYFWSHTVITENALRRKFDVQDTENLMSNSMSY